jgi:IS4 transposase
MTDLFFRLKCRGISIDKSTFSKASKHRDFKVFVRLFEKLKAQAIQKLDRPEKLILFPVDSTVITLTSKLLWQKKYHQVKLFAGTSNEREIIDGVHIHFGQGHDSQYGNKTIEATAENSICVMDRGFASSERVKELLQQKNKYFVLRIKNDATLKMQEDGTFKVWSGRREVKVRLVTYSDLETGTEFRWVTNLPESGELSYSNEEIGEIYRRRWQIELLWKFLKMHLKLARLITKNENGICIQIYAALIAYLILQLVEVPQEFGKTLLDKLRYLQAFVSEKISYVHWLRELVVCC